MVIGFLLDKYNFVMVIYFYFFSCLCFSLVSFTLVHFRLSSRVFSSCLCFW